MKVIEFIKLLEVIELLNLLSPESISTRDRTKDTRYKTQEIREYTIEKREQRKENKEKRKKFSTIVLRTFLTSVIGHPTPDLLLLG